MPIQFKPRYRILFADGEPIIMKPHPNSYRINRNDVWLSICPYQDLFIHVENKFLSEEEREKLI